MSKLLNRKSAEEESGFTLIEIMVALVVVSVGLLGLGSFTFSILDSSQLAKERLGAVHVAEQVIEFWQHDTNDFLPTISSANCAVSTAGSQSTFPKTVSCTPTTGVSIPYTIVVKTAVPQGPLASSLTTMQSFTNQGYPNDPIIKLVQVNWSHKGAPHSIYLTHMTR